MSEWHPWQTDCRTCRWYDEQWRPQPEKEVVYRLLGISWPRPGCKHDDYPIFDVDAVAYCAAWEGTAVTDEKTV